MIVEPVAANMGVAPPAPGFLEGLREITQRDGALLIFDEVITGFRIAYGGAQNFFRIQPDLSVFGKIIGGGLPVAAYGGRREIMEMIAPLGPVYQAGTLSGNPLAMRAGLATLPKLAAPGFYDALNRKAQRLAEGLRAALKESGIPGHVNIAGSLLTLFFTASAVRDYAGAKKSDTTRFAAFFSAHARPRHFSAAVAVRSAVRLRRPHRRGYRPHHRRRARKFARDCRSQLKRWF